MQLLIDMTMKMLAVCLPLADERLYSELEPVGIFAHRLRLI